MMFAGLIVMIYLSGVVAVLLERAFNFEDRPASFPMGGWPATTVIAVLWPPIVALAIVVLAIDFAFGWTRGT